MLPRKEVKFLSKQESELQSGLDARTITDLFAIIFGFGRLRIDQRQSVSWRLVNGIFHSPFMEIESTLGPIPASRDPGWERTSG